MVRRPATRQIRPSRIYETVTNQLNHRVKPKLKVEEPVWFKVVESIPPSETLTRPLPPQHNAPNSKARKRSKKLFQPQQLTYPEDGLRNQFYGDHPWELARPRMIVEMDGKDALYHDWSKGLRQPGLPLSGESVVQRQLWLMENAGIKRNQAYDQVRKEFYRLRQEEEIEQRIAKEEARMVGAYFGQTFTQVGMTLEDQAYERWKKWAEKEMETIRVEQQESSGGQPDDSDVGFEGEDDLAQVIERGPAP